MQAQQLFTICRKYIVGLSMVLVSKNLPKVCECACVCVRVCVRDARGHAFVCSCVCMWLCNHVLRLHSYVVLSLHGNTELIFI